LFAALFKGCDLLMIARFDKARAEDDNEIESYCRSAVAMFIAAHSGNDHVGGCLSAQGQKTKFESCVTESASRSRPASQS
jgi:hypothetical protein